MMCIFVSFATHVTQQPMERLHAEREKGSAMVLLVGRVLSHLPLLCPIVNVMQVL